MTSTLQQIDASLYYAGARIARNLESIEHHKEVIDLLTKSNADALREIEDLKREAAMLKELAHG